MVTVTSYITLMLHSKKNDTMCNKCYVVKPPLVPMLTIAAIATISPTLLASASIVVTAVILLVLVSVVHLVPLLRVPLPVG